MLDESIPGTSVQGASADVSVLSPILLYDGVSYIMAVVVVVDMPSPCIVTRIGVSAGVSVHEVVVSVAIGGSVQVLVQDVVSVTWSAP